MLYEMYLSHILFWNKLQISSHIRWHIWLCIDNFYPIKMTSYFNQLSLNQN